MIRYRDLATRIRWEINEEKTFTHGQMLPNHRQLAQRFGTTRTTVARALAHLLAEGIVEVIPGKGTFVTGAPHQQRRPAEILEHDLRARARNRQPVPRTEQLSRTYGISPSTVRRVVRRLICEGTLIRAPGGGFEAP